jgi:hypothetical protein
MSGLKDVCRKNVAAPGNWHVCLTILWDHFVKDSSNVVLVNPFDK